MTTCPECQRVVETVHGRDSSRAPRGGDLVVCLNCGAICIFEPSLQLHVLRPRESHAIPARVLLDAIAFSNHIIRSKGGTPRES